MASITITNGEELTVKETLKEVYGKISNQEKMGESQVTLNVRTTYMNGDSRSMEVIYTPTVFMRQNIMKYQ
jgi:hypothetical protein